MIFDPVGDLLAAALACAEAALDPPAGRAAISPGAMVAWDECPEGQVWSRLVSLVPAPSTPPARQARCGVDLWAATIGIGVLRCAAVLDDDGNPPPPAALTADARAMTRDAEALKNAIVCCLAPDAVPSLAARLTIDRFDPLGPDGGFVGGEWVCTTWVADCGCPPTVEPPPGDDPVPLD